MTDKEKVIKELKEALDSLDITNAYRINLIRAIEYLQEEPVSEDFEAEKFIEDCTRNCSNIVVYSGMSEGSELRYHEWLSPDEAKKAVEIARTETINEVVEWLKKNVTYTHPRKGTKECIVNIAKLKDDLKDE